MKYAAHWLQSKIIQEELTKIVYNLIDQFIKDLYSCVDKSVMGKSCDVSVKSWEERFIHECQDLAPVGLIDFKYEKVAKKIENTSLFKEMLQTNLESAKGMLRKESYESLKKH